MRRPKIIVHNHFAKPARDAGGEYASYIRVVRQYTTAKLREELADLKKIHDPVKPNGDYAPMIRIVENLLRQRKGASDNYYHAGQVNGYYILEGASGDKGRWLVRNGKYDIVKTVGSKAEAESFARRAPNGGAMAQAADGGRTASEIKAEIERLRITREKADTAKERDSAHVKLQQLFDELKRTA